MSVKEALQLRIDRMSDEEAADLLARLQRKAAQAEERRSEGTGSVTKANGESSRDQAQVDL